MRPPNYLQSNRWASRLDRDRREPSASAEPVEMLPPWRGRSGKLAQACDEGLGTFGADDVAAVGATAPEGPAVAIGTNAGFSNRQKAPARHRPDGGRSRPATPKPQGIALPDHWGPARLNAGQFRTNPANAPGTRPFPADAKTIPRSAAVPPWPCVPECRKQPQRREPSGESVRFEAWTAGWGSASQRQLAKLVCGSQ